MSQSPGEATSILHAPSTVRLSRREFAISAPTSPWCTWRDRDATRTHERRWGKKGERKEGADKLQMQGELDSNVEVE